MGTESVTTIACTTSSTSPSQRTCQIPLAAPGFALVFLSDSALEVSETGGAEATTFPTTAETRTRNTVTIDPAVLATSNGHVAMGNENARVGRLGSTSAGSVNGGVETRTVKVVVGLVGGLIGAVVVGVGMVLA